MLVRTIRLMGGAGLLLAAGAAITPLAAQTWNAATDWSTTQNPGSTWTYGSETAGGGYLTPFGSYYTSPGCGTVNVDCWHSQAPNSGAPYSGDTEHNQTGASTTLPANELGLRGIGSTGYSDVRWTAPIAGHFDVTGFFAQGSDNGGDGVPNSVDVFEDGASIFTAVANGTETQQAFSFLDVALDAGAYLDFVTYTAPGVGVTGERLEANITVNSGSTTTTPEPSSMALLGTGLIGLVPMVRRRAARGR